MWQWSRCRTFDLCSIGLEFAAVTWASNLPEIWLPLGYATEMSANGGNSVKTIFRVHNIHLLIFEKCDGVEWIQIRIAGAKCSWRLEQYIGRKITIGDDQRTDRGNAQSRQGRFVQEFAAGGDQAGARI